MLLFTQNIRFGFVSTEAEFFIIIIILFYFIISAILSFPVIRKVTWSYKQYIPSGKLHFFSPPRVYLFAYCLSRTTWMLKRRDLASLGWPDSLKSTKHLRAPNRKPTHGELIVHGNSGKKCHLMSYDWQVCAQDIPAGIFSPGTQTVFVSVSCTQLCNVESNKLQVQCVTLDSGSQWPPPHPVSSMLLSSWPCWRQ